jgi:hypothetical protein
MNHTFVNFQQLVVDRAIMIENKRGEMGEINNHQRVLGINPAESELSQ